MLHIIDYPWHQAHLYRLTALPALFSVAAIRQPVWNEHQRPVPDNVRFVDADQIPQDADLALLHLDQWCDRQQTRGWPYRFMKAKTQGIPQVIIMHGTPDSGENRRAILRLIGDLPVVCNSHQAAREWDGGEGRMDRYGLPQFRAIIHGYTDEFYNYPLSMRRAEAFTVCSGGNMSRWYHGLPLVLRLMRDIDLVWYGPSGNRDWLPDYHSYRDMLASSLIYFSPTRRAPMPGSRTEALLSGCCVVSTPGNDWEDYIDNWETGVIVENYREARDVLFQLLVNPKQAHRIGQQGREMAREKFSAELYTGDWLVALEELEVIQ